jgi:adenosylmethionine-8-amino-7-oxononanoate aminotransferase
VIPGATAAASRVFHRVAGRALPTAVRADGALLWDAEGRRYLDGSGGAAVVNVGHGRAEIAQAIARQASAVAYVHGTQFTSAVLEEYASRLAAHAPGARLYLVSGGSEANETAIKLARAYQVAVGRPERHKIVTATTSYHGGTLATLGLSGRPALRRPYLPLLAPAHHAAAAFCYHCALHREFPACEVACADDLEATIRREGPETVAAFLAEPVIGASAGAAAPPDDYARRAREICARHGVLYVADEVMTGFGRTGRFFASARHDAPPDIVTCGKGMSGGYLPAGGVLAAERIAAAVEGGGGFVHGFTFSHHPVVAAACLATLDILERERLVERADALGPVLGRALSALLAHPHVGDVRGRGLLWAVEIVEDRRARRPYPRARRRAEAVAARALARGLVTYPSGGAAGDDGDLILLAPPFVVSEDQIGEMATTLDAALTEEGL